MIDNPYLYSIALYRRDGTLVGEAKPACDWTVLAESTRFTGIRAGQSGLGSGRDRVRVQPLWDPEQGHPYVAGFSVTVFADDGASATSEFTTKLFRASAEDASRELVRRGQLATGELFWYRTLAWPALSKTTPDTNPPRHFKVEAVETRLTLIEGDLSQACRDTVPHGASDADTGDHPVVIPHRVLEQITEQTRAAGAHECGGVLIGRLCRDSGAGDVFAEVTACVPASLARGDATRLRFTPECWCAVRAALDLRHRDEVVHGWYHSHPFTEKCRTCPEKKKSQCLVGEFFSMPDRDLHRAVFPRAHSVALVATGRHDGEITYSLYGWRGGSIERRGFHVRLAHPCRITDSQPSTPVGAGPAMPRFLP